MEIRKKGSGAQQLTLGDLKPGHVFRFAACENDERPHDTLYMKVQLPSHEHNTNPGNARCVTLIQASLSWKAVDRPVIPVKGYFQEVE